MKITLLGNQVDIGDRLRNHVEENVLNSVNKYFAAPISCNVSFAKISDDTFEAEVTVHPAKGIILKGTGQAGDPYSAFDDANTHIATRLRRHKTKLNDHKGRTTLAEIANQAVFSFDESLEEVEIQPGDVNCDGEVDISDVILLARYTSEDASCTVTTEGLLNGDMNQDSKYTANDVTLILRKIAKLDDV